MAENTQEIPSTTSETPNKIGRRGFFKGLTATAASLAAGSLMQREINVMNEGLKTNEGVFFPLYESHTKGISVQDIPQNLDGFFREGSFDKDTWEAQPSRVLLNKYAVPEGNDVEGTVQAFKDDVLKQLAKDNVKIVMGDTSIPDEDDETSRERDMNIRTIGGAAIAATGYIYQGLREGIDIFRGKYETTPNEMSRRKFVRNSFIAAGAVAAAPGIANRAMSAEFLLNGYDVNRRSAIERIFDRVSGMLQSHASPEDHLLFFRSVVMADKILTATEKLKQQTGRLPRVAFNVGAAHTGIEDYLAAGHDFNRWVISHYSKDFLKQVIDINGDIENFCSARVMTLPQDIDIKNSNLFVRTSNGQTVQNPDEVNKLIKDELVTDQSLLKSMTALFGQEEAKTKAEVDNARENDFTALREELKRFNLGTNISSQINQKVDAFKGLKQVDYTQVMDVFHINSEDTKEVGTVVTITLPDGSPPYHLKKTDDIKVITDNKDEKPQTDQLELFIDSDKKLAKNTGNADLVNIPDDQLLTTINEIFIDSPKDPKAWKLEEGIRPGQKGLDATVKKGTTRFTYHISKDGHLSQFIFYNVSPEA